MLLDTIFPCYVYIAKCSDGSFYTGITHHPSIRIRQHNGILPGGAKYTQKRRPVFFIYMERWNSKNEARQRELKIKNMTHEEKAQLIAESPNGILNIDNY